MAAPTEKRRQVRGLWQRMTEAVFLEAVRFHALRRKGSFACVCLGVCLRKRCNEWCFAMPKHQNKGGTTVNHRP